MDYETLKSRCQDLLDSGTLPNHYYRLGHGNIKLQDAQGKYLSNVNKLIWVVQKCFELGVPTTFGIPNLIPQPDGEMTIKGDLAKSLIIASKTCEYWEDSFDEHTFTHTIKAKRVGYPELTQSFGKLDAVRANLWITDAMVERHPDLRKKPWYAYQKRQCMYRALGFIARDGWSDILHGIKTIEEYQDYPIDPTAITKGNKEITLVDSQIGEKKVKEAVKLVNKASRL